MLLFNLSLKKIAAQEENAIFEEENWRRRKKMKTRGQRRRKRNGAGKWMTKKNDRNYIHIMFMLFLKMQDAGITT